MDEQTKKEIEKITNKDKGFKTQEVIILVIITCIFSFFAGSSYVKIKSNPDTLQSESETYSKELSSFINNYQNVVDNYYEEIDEETLLTAAFKAILEELGDSYSIYMDEDSYTSLNLTLEGSYSGLGISVYKDATTDYIVISSVFENSPAETAGLEAGDIITAIDGNSSKDLSTTDFSKLVLQGEQDVFELEILRGTKTLTVSVAKNGVVIPSVESKIYQKNGHTIGYIYISIFANNTYNQFAEALADLENQGIDSLIIDVRSNTGGHLTAVSKIISLFLDSSYVAYQLEQNNKVQKIYSSGDTTKNYTIAFLADSYSASASEVLIGSLKDNLGAIVVGQKTYGKGTVQELITLESGDQYKITTKKWLTPNGTWVNDTEGIEPDIEVSLSNSYYKNPTDENDNQLQTVLEELSK